MDWSWQCAEVAATVSGSEPVRLPCVGLLKAMVYACKVNMRELLRQIFSAARRVNSTVLLRKVTCSLVTHVRKCIQADGGHFEQLE
jgi:hypothetical protein